MKRQKKGYSVRQPLYRCSEIRSVIVRSKHRIAENDLHFVVVPIWKKAAQLAEVRFWGYIMSHQRRKVFVAVSQSLSMQRGRPVTDEEVLKHLKQMKKHPLSRSMKCR